MGHHHGKGGGLGKIVGTVVGFTLGFMNPAIFGLGAGAAIAGGVLGASLGSNIWLATHRPHIPNLDMGDEEGTVSYNFDIMQNMVSNDSMIPIIYGTRKWGGYQTFHLSSMQAQHEKMYTFSDDDKEGKKHGVWIQRNHLTKDVVFCEGEVDAITDVRVNDLGLSTGRYYQAFNIEVHGQFYAAPPPPSNSQSQHKHHNNQHDHSKDHDFVAIPTNQNTHRSTHTYTPITQNTHIDDIRSFTQYNSNSEANRATGNCFTLASENGNIYLGINGNRDVIVTNWSGQEICDYINSGHFSPSGNFWATTSTPNVTLTDTLIYVGCNGQLTDAEGEYLDSVLTGQLRGAFHASVAKHEQLSYLDITNLNCPAYVDASATGIPGCSYSAYTGSSYQSPPDNYNVVGGYKNLAWLRAELQASDTLQGGNPTVTAVIRGLKILDTRTGSYGYSENPAMIVRDYLVNRRYGMGRWIKEGMLDEDSFKECADYCDEQVSYYIPSQLAQYDNLQAQINSLQNTLSSNNKLQDQQRQALENQINSLITQQRNLQYTQSEEVLVTTPRYTTNIILADSQSFLNNIQRLLATFGGSLVFYGDKVALRMEKPEPVAYHFNESNIAAQDGKSTIRWSTLSLTDTPNRYNIKFYDPSNGYVGVLVQVDDDGDQHMRGKIVPHSIELSGVTSQSQALRLANLFMTKNKMCPARVVFSTTTMAMHLQPCDVISLTYKDIKGALFRIDSITEDKGLYTLSCSQYDESIYNDQLGAQIIWKNPCTIGNPLSDVVPEVSNIQTAQDYYIQPGGNYVSGMVITWNNPNYQFFQEALVSYSFDGYSWTILGRTKLDHILFTNVAIHQSYIIKVQVVNSAGRYSQGITTPPIYITGKDMPPADITGLTVAQYDNFFRIVFDKPLDKDYKYTEIRYGGTDWDEGQFLGYIVGNTGVLADGAIKDGTNIFRAKAIDNGGNYSINDDEYVLQVSNLDKYKNYIIQRNDIGLTDGELQGLVRLPTKELVSTSSLCLGDYKTFADLPIKAFVASVTDIKYVSPIVDTLKIGKTGITFDFKHTFIDTSPIFQNFMDRLFGEHISDTFRTMMDDVSVILRFRMSNDNKTWTPWQTYIGGSYVFRYIQYSLEAHELLPSCRAAIQSLYQTYDVPDFESHNRYDVPKEGLQVTYDCYTIPYEIVPVVLNGFGNVYADIENVTEKGLTLKCYDRQGNPVNGTVNLTIKGY